MRMARVGLVHVLAASAAGAEGVDAKLRRVDRDLGRFVGLGHHGHGAGAGVDAALRLGGGHALHAVAAGLESQLLVHPLAFHPDDHFLVAAQVAGAFAHQFGAPALALAVAQVQPRQVAGEQRAFFAAGAGADFNKGVAFVVRVARQQGLLDFTLQPVQVGLAIGNFLLGHGGHVGVVQQGLGGGHVGLALAERTPALHQRVGVGLFARQRPVALHVRHHRGVGQAGVQFGQAHFQAVQLLAQAVFHGSGGQGDGKAPGLGWPALQAWRGRR